MFDSGSSDASFDMKAMGRAGSKLLATEQTWTGRLLVTLAPPSTSPSGSWQKRRFPR